MRFIYEGLKVQDLETVITHSGLAKATTREVPLEAFLILQMLAGVIFQLQLGNAVTQVIQSTGSISVDLHNRRSSLVPLLAPPYIIYIYNKHV